MRHLFAARGCRGRGGGEGGGWGNIVACVVYFATLCDTAYLSVFPIRSVDRGWGRTPPPCNVGSKKENR
jgi:hypothetical protein